MTYEYKIIELSPLDTSLGIDEALLADKMIPILADLGKQGFKLVCIDCQGRCFFVKEIP